MSRKLFYAPAEHPRCGDDLEHPWKYAVAPYRVAPHVWQVGGQDDVCAYLLDAGEGGLILIDTGYRSSFYLLLDSIYRIGFDPRQIRKILLSHWHWDHVNGVRFMQELSGAEVYLSRTDEAQYQLHKDLTDPLPLVPFRVDHFYDDSRTIDLGRFSVQTRLTPGHTPGATSFFFEGRDDETGEVFRCAMHGGVGVFMMSADFLREHNLSPELPHIFVRDCLELSHRPVDICLPSHLNQGNVKPNIPADRTDYRVWIDDRQWSALMLGRAKAVQKMYPDRYPAVDKEPMQIVDGCIDLPKKGGLEIEVDRDQVMKANKLYMDNCLGARDDAKGMQYLIPGWKFDPKRPCMVR